MLREAEPCYLVHDPGPRVAKATLQDAPPSGVVQGVLDFDPHAARQSVKLAPLPMRPRCPRGPQATQGLDDESAGLSLCGLRVRLHGDGRHALAGCGCGFNRCGISQPEEWGQWWWAPSA